MAVPSIRLQAQIDTNVFAGRTEVALFIGNLSNQGTPDTVYGALSHRSQYLPTRISWGVPRSTDTSARAKNIRARRKLRDAKISLPKWRNLSGSLAIQDINSDSLPDVILYLRGQIRVHSELHDTARCIVIFAQTGLDSLSSCDVEKISRTFQQSPFYAMDIVAENILTQPDVREPSGATSFILEPIRPAGATRKRDSAQQPAAMAPPVTGNPAWINVYPNPAVYSTNVEIRKVPQGEYRVRVIAVNGSVSYDQSVVVDDSQEILRTIPLGRIATGYYVVQLLSQDHLVATYPLVITH